MFKIKRIYYNQLALYLLYHYLARSFWLLFITIAIEKGKVLKYKTSGLSQISAVRTGLEPVTSCVTGRHSNQLN